MGVLLGQAARFRGAKVDLIHGSLQISPGLLEGLNSIEARSANDMLCALEKLQTSADVIAMAAAIADIQSKKCSSIKIGKEKLLESLEDKFEIVPDLLKRLVKRKKANQVFLGFAALTGNDGEIQKLAISKKQTKGCDLLMANPIDRLNQGFGSELNGGWLIGPENEMQKIPVNSKFSIAHQLLDAIKINSNNDSIFFPLVKYRVLSSCGEDNYQTIIRQNILIWIFHLQNPWLITVLITY